MDAFILFLTEQKAKEEYIQEYLHQFVLIYIDDILIYSRNLAEHRQHVALALGRLRRHQLYMKAEKCSFHQTSIQFLSYNIDQHGVQMDEGKVDAVWAWPTPKTIKELQCLNSQISTEGSSEITVTLPHHLPRSKKGPKKLQWNAEAAAAMERLKTAFTSAPILVHLNPEIPFCC